MIAALEETKDQLDSQISVKQAQLDQKDALLYEMMDEQSHLQTQLAEKKKELSQRDALIAMEQDMIEQLWDKIALRAPLRRILTKQFDEKFCFQTNFWWPDVVSYQNPIKAIKVNK